MTEQEIKKMDKLLDEALMHARRAKELYAEIKDVQTIASCISTLRTADSRKSYADGIRQALVILGFKSDKMQELNKLLD